MHWNADDCCCRQVATQVELHQYAQKYNAQLQEYNGKLQNDLTKSAEQLQQLQAEKAGWAEETSANRGTIRTLEQQLEAARGSAEAADAARRCWPRVRWAARLE